MGKNVSPEKLMALGEAAKVSRRNGSDAEYLNKAQQLLHELEKVGILPCPADSVKLISAGRTNFCVGEVNDEKRPAFLKVSPGGLERSFYEHVVNGKVSRVGERYCVPRCHFLQDAGGFAIFLFEWFDNITAEKTPELDRIRVAGIANFNANNSISDPDERLPNIPRHGLAIRSDSVDVINETLREPGLAEAQEQIVSSWPVVEARLKKIPLCLSLRDSGRANVMVQDFRAVMIDNGAVHYAPVGFDFWAYLFDQDDVLDAAERLAEDHEVEFSHNGLRVSRDSVVFVSLAACCIMSLDRFVRHKHFGNTNRVLKLQEVARELINQCR